MGIGKYIYTTIVATFALVGIAIFAAMSVDITFALMTDSDPRFTTGFGFLGVALGLGSLITTFADIVKD